LKQLVRTLVHSTDAVTSIQALDALTRNCKIKQEEGVVALQFSRRLLYTFEEMIDTYVLKRLDSDYVDDTTQQLLALADDSTAMTRPVVVLTTSPLYLFCQANLPHDVQGQNYYVSWDALKPVVKSFLGRRIYNRFLQTHEQLLRTNLLNIPCLRFLRHGACSSAKCDKHLSYLGYDLREYNLVINQLVQEIHLLNILKARYGCGQIEEEEFDSAYL